MADVEIASSLIIGEIAIAAAALDRAIDRCVMSCLPSLPPEQHVVVLSRLSFRQRLDIAHELARPLLDEHQREAFNAWRRRVAKVWARCMRMLSRGRVCVGPADEMGARGVIRHLGAEAEATRQWCQALNPVIPAYAPGYRMTDKRAAIL